MNNEDFKQSNLKQSDSLSQAVEQINGLNINSGSESVESLLLPEEIMTLKQLDTLKQNWEIEKAELVVKIREIESTLQNRSLLFISEIELYDLSQQENLLHHEFDNKLKKMKKAEAELEDIKQQLEEIKVVEALQRDIYSYGT